MGGMSNTSIEGLVEELTECSDSDLDERVRHLELERRRLDAELAIAVGEVDRRRSYLDDGHRSLTAYLRGTCNYSDAEAARIGRLTAAAANVPGLAESLHDGRVGSSQANELAVAHANRRVRDKLTEFAPMLLDVAERLSFREFRTCVQRFVMLADLDGAHDDLDESIDNRRARIVNLNGSLALDGGGGDPLVNVELEAIFRHFCELEYDADVATRRAAHGDNADDKPLARTATQRGYDALVTIMRGALANHQAGRGAPATEPLVNILMDHRTWAWLLADTGLAPDVTLAGEQVDPFTGLASPGDLLAELMTDPDSLGSRRCETSTGQVLDPHTVLRAALAGHIRRAVLGADSRPIDLGRTSRLFTGAARQAAKLLAVQCDHLGCGLPAELCQVDHSTEWSNDGRTDQDNAGVECGTHNRLKHRQRWRTRRDIDGRTHTIRANGTIMLPVGVRSPVFAGDPPPTSEAAVAATPDLPLELERTIEAWTNDSESDIERHCRVMRGVAIRHSATFGEIDLDGFNRRLRVGATS